jgi:hypothetical protein
MAYMDEAFALVAESHTVRNAELAFGANRCLILAKLGRDAEAIEELERVEHLYEMLPAKERADGTPWTQVVEKCRNELKSTNTVCDPDSAAM